MSDKRRRVPLGLRQHLIETISYTGYATKNRNIEKVSEALGVFPELIIEARALAQHRKRIAKENRQNVIPKKHLQFQTYKMDLKFPEEFYNLWLNYCEQRKIKSGVFIISVLHAYLLGTFEPECLLARHWYVNGVSFSSSNWKHRHRLSMSMAMLVGLQERAKKHGRTKLPLIRAILSSVIEGKFCQPGTFEILTRPRLFTDPNAYLEMSKDPNSKHFGGHGPRVRLVESYEHSEPISKEDPQK